MVTFVFDSSTAMRYLDDKTGADRVEEIVQPADSLVSIEFLSPNP